jgi:rfaE bifunctional protein nucleotidyltransferase chain/domain
LYLLPYHALERSILGRILTNEAVKAEINKWRKANKRIVFTNGCFDLIHRGHIEYLTRAKMYGDILIVGLNSDDSVRRLKGKSRPYMRANDRAYILSQLNPVDVVVVFFEDTPYDLIKMVEPDILVKGGDYQIDEICGRDIVEKRGGSVFNIPFIRGYSTTNLIKKIQTDIKKLQ